MLRYASLRAFTDEGHQTLVNQTLPDDRPCMALSGLESAVKIWAFFPNKLGAKDFWQICLVW